ncbi:transposase [Lutispora sp.]|uniref:transposase n=1 Tax=Lutispora sp. TaxID=2828727 RepID=UPI00356A5D0F
MHFFNIPTVSLLCIFLSLSSEIRDFCQFDDYVPDESFFSRFKISFEKDIANLFDAMVPYIIDICNQMDESLPSSSTAKGLSSMLIYDTSGLKPKVKESNPKTLVCEINKQKAFAKIINNDNFNPYAAAYKNMPKQSSCNPNIKLDFVNGHFGYFYKFGLLTNGFGIPLHIHFFDDAFYSSVSSDFDTPEDQKYTFDNASLKPVLTPFLDSLPNSKFKHFLADSEFDSYDNFGFLKSCGFDKVFIPLNPRMFFAIIISSVMKKFFPRHRWRFFWL